MNNKETLAQRFNEILKAYGVLFSDRLGVLQPETIGHKICQGFVDEVGLCVTLTPTKFVYAKGGETGFSVGLINYPRFPESKAKIRAKALELAKRLKYAYSQRRVSVVFSDYTVMLSN